MASAASRWLAVLLCVEASTPAPLASARPPPSAIVRARRALAELRTQRSLIERSEAALRARLPALQDDSAERTRLSRAAYSQWWWADYDARGLSAEVQLQRGWQLVRGALNVRRPRWRERALALVRGAKTGLARTARRQQADEAAEIYARVRELRASYERANLEAVAVGRLFVDGMLSADRARAKSEDLDGVIAAASARLERTAALARALEARERALSELDAHVRCRLVRRAAAYARHADGEPGAAPPSSPAGSTDAAASRGAPERVQRWRRAVRARREAALADASAVEGLLRSAIERAENVLITAEMGRYTTERELRRVAAGNLTAADCDLLCDDPVELRRRARAERRGRRRRAAQGEDGGADVTEEDAPAGAPALHEGIPAELEPLSWAGLCLALPVRAARAVRTTVGESVAVATGAIYPSLEQLAFIAKVGALATVPLFVWVRICDGLGAIIAAFAFARGKPAAHAFNNALELAWARRPRLFVLLVLCALGWLARWVLVALDEDSIAAG